MGNVVPSYTSVGETIAACEQIPIKVPVEGLSLIKWQQSIQQKHQSIKQKWNKYVACNDYQQFIKLLSMPRFIDGKSDIAVVARLIWQFSGNIQCINIYSDILNHQLKGVKVSMAINPYNSDIYLSDSLSIFKLNSETRQLKTIYTTHQQTTNDFISDVMIDTFGKNLYFITKSDYHIVHSINIDNNVDINNTESDSCIPYINCRSSNKASQKIDTESKNGQNTNKNKNDSNKDGNGNETELIAGKENVNNGNSNNDDIDININSTNQEASIPVTVITENIDNINVACVQSNWMNYQKNETSFYDDYRKIQWYVECKDWLTMWTSDYNPATRTYYHTLDIKKLLKRITLLAYYCNDPNTKTKATAKPKSYEKRFLYNINLTRLIKDYCELQCPKCNAKEHGSKEEDQQSQFEEMIDFLANKSIEKRHSLSITKDEIVNKAEIVKKFIQWNCYCKDFLSNVLTFTIDKYCNAIYIILTNKVLYRLKKTMVHDCHEWKITHRIALKTQLANTGGVPLGVCNIDYDSIYQRLIISDNYNVQALYL